MPRWRVATISAAVVLPLVGAPVAPGAQPAPPGAAQTEQQRVSAAKARFAREAAACRNQVAAKVKQGESFFDECGAISQPEKDANVAKLHALGASATQECASNATAAESAFLLAEQQRLETEMATLRRGIKNDQQALKRLGLPTVSDAFETWENLSEEQRQTLWKDTIVGTVSVGLQAISVASRPLGSFTPPQANALISRLRAAGANDPFVEATIRQVAITPGKPVMAANIRELATALDHGLAGGATRDAFAAGDLFAAGIEILGAFLPVVGVASSAAKAIVNYGFAERALGVLQPDIAQVINLPEQDLAAVGRLSASIKTGVGRLGDQKAALAVVAQARQALGS